VAAEEEEERGGSRKRNTYKASTYIGQSTTMARSLSLI
jgi:hypothetical protein